MPRFKLVIEYDGGPFVGWQRQANGPSIQEAIEDAIFAFSGERVRIQGAGRTDAGVHATGQVAHASLSRTWPLDTVRDAINAHLKPQPVAILSVAEVPESFNARFSAVGRRYRYRILDRRPPPTVTAGQVWHIPVPLDPEAMAAAGAALVGRHDFSTFRAAECQAAGPVRTLERFDVIRSGEEIHVETAARSFLHHQVRSMVGSVALVGSGKRPAGWVGEILAARERQACGPMAPAHGLCLTGVAYPSDEDTHERADSDVEGQP